MFVHFKQIPLLSASKRVCLCITFDFFVFPKLFSFLLLFQLFISLTAHYFQWAPVSHYTQFSFKRKFVLYTGLFCLKT